MLRQQFLPLSFSKLGDYPDSLRVQAHTRAFLVLSHAELETYFEEWAKEIARASEDVWKRKRRVTAPLAFLLGCDQKRLDLPETISGSGAKDIPVRLNELVGDMFSRYYKRIKDNHGVKERNVLILFAPLGVPAAAFAPTLLPNLDTLGADRGTQVHQSARAVTSILDPESEHKRIEGVLDDLGPFDTWAQGYRQTIK